MGPRKREMSFTVVCPQGVAIRNSPNFNDRNNAVVGPTVGTTLQGEVVPGDGGLYYLRTAQGFVPFYKQDGSVVLGPSEQVTSAQVVKNEGVAYRNTAAYEDRRGDMPGPSCGQIIIGIQVPGDRAQFLQTSNGFVPFTDPGGNALMKAMPAGTQPSDAAPSIPPPRPQMSQGGWNPPPAPASGAPPPPYSQGFPQQQGYG